MRDNAVCLKKLSLIEKNVGEKKGKTLATNLSPIGHNINVVAKNTELREEY